MSTNNNRDNVESMKQWQRARLAAYGGEFRPKGPGPSNVTVLAYFFRPVETAETHFPYTKCAIFETWRHCGAMKTVIVSHAVTPPVADFANRYPDLVEIQVEPSLRPLPPGDIASMSADCNARLHTRFSTDEVLIVQSDGFPVRPGLEGFLGRYDYLGAPFVRRNWKTRLAGIWPRRAVGNGGFSLRSRKICKAAGARWPRFRKGDPDRWTVREDVFYCLTLPLLSRSFRRTCSFAPLDVALRFSYDDLYEDPPDDPPFGFHGAGAFALYRKRGWIGEP